MLRHQDAIDSWKEATTTFQKKMAETLEGQDPEIIAFGRNYAARQMILETAEVTKRKNEMFTQIVIFSEVFLKLGEAVIELKSKETLRTKP